MAVLKKYHLPQGMGCDRIQRGALIVPPAEFIHVPAEQRCVSCTKRWDADIGYAVWSLKWIRERLRIAEIKHEKAYLAHFRERVKAAEQDLIKVVMRHYPGDVSI